MRRKTVIASVSRYCGVKLSLRALAKQSPALSDYRGGFRSMFGIAASGIALLAMTLAPKAAKKGCGFSQQLPSTRRECASAHYAERFTVRLRQKTKPFGGAVAQRKKLNGTQSGVKTGSERRNSRLADEGAYFTLRNQVGVPNVAPIWARISSRTRNRSNFAYTPRTPCSFEQTIKNRFLF